MNSRKQTPLKIEVRESADIFEVRASAATQEKISFLAVDTLVMSVYLILFMYSIVWTLKNCLVAVHFDTTFCPEPNFPFVHWPDADGDRDRITGR